MGAPAFSGFAALSTPSGSFSYPIFGGDYGNGENALFILNPTEAGGRTLTFTQMDVESGTGCGYDAVSLLTWTNNEYTRVDRLAKFF